MFTGYLHYEDKIPTAEFQPATLSVTGKMPRTTKPWEIIWDLTYQTCYAKKWLTNIALSVYWSSIDKLENLFHMQTWKFTN